jgi:hypothetical protein
VTTPEAARARIAAAKAELAAAEEAYRQIVPCEHRMITIHHPDDVRCTDCGTELPDPRGCQHLRIDNNTDQCVDCGEKMLRPHRKLVTVRSAPNKAACTRPDCGGMDDPECENPTGLYIPDEDNAEEVPVRYEMSYECARCRYNGDIFVSDAPPIWDCGHRHRGADIPIRASKPVKD